MAKADMNAILKRRMAATRQASELQASDEAFQRIFQRAPPSAPSEICDLPLDKLDSFFTADIGFKPYAPAKLEAFAQQLQEEGLLVRIIVRRIPHSDRYEILAGHNRTAAARLAGWTKIAAEIVVADDARAISIATLTNLLQRQDLSIIERGKAYKALLEAKNRNGQRNAAKETFGDNRQRYNARAIVAEFFGVHAQAAYQVMGANAELDSAKYIWDRIDNADKAVYSKSEIVKLCKGRFKKVDDMGPALQMLVDMGYLREAEQETGGRPKTMYIVNPRGKKEKKGEKPGLSIGGLSA